ncbi:hypothetical protein [Fodinibius salsisoli]|uniref:Uncharacterized protein n=1 Tax=Fodinibius salsisoli TaxID=2820877 RepID=A0ABT3PLW1_9BACT|nr:hypothetical protein [Fodinibius salsisoli]MCW9706935.1 hypothetical protein [Fodinibius salsisoli]
MIKQSTTASVMEFTSFRKKEDITEEALIAAVLDFESSFLSKQEGLVLDCLVKGNSGKYANVMFAKDMASLKQIEQQAHSDKAAQHFFELLDIDSVDMAFQAILKEAFETPDHFSCVEYGTFSLNNSGDTDSLIKASEDIEDQYLDRFDNTKAHFMGKVEEGRYSEVTLGRTLGKTKQICEGYRQEHICQPLLNMIDTQSMELSFWYLIA